MDSFFTHQGVEDDDMNMICLGGLVVGHAFAWELVEIFFKAKFRGAERFQQRIAKVVKLENRETKT
jgi:ribose 5-phosphate isomerase B